MRILMTNFMTKNLFFAEKYSFDLQNIYVKKEPESIDYSNENSFSGSFAKMDQTGIEPVSKNQSPVLLRA